LADANLYADQRFDLAFAINKVGEAMQVQRDFDGALKAFADALELAVQIESSPRMEYKLQSATTRKKIAVVLLAKTSSNFDNALRNYSAAIAREESILATDRTNNIVRSNLADAYEGRAQAFEHHGDFNPAFEDYAHATDMLGRLVAEDARDTAWLERLANVHRKFGSALQRYAQDRSELLDKAVEQYESEVASREKLAEKAPSNTTWQKNLAESNARLQQAKASAAVRSKPAKAD
jgi:tetratricopeptide (TPR) repeat protein